MITDQIGRREVFKVNGHLVVLVSAFRWFFSDQYNGGHPVYTPNPPVHFSFQCRRNCAGDYK